MFAVLREIRDAVIHVDADGDLQSLQVFRKNHFNAAAKSHRLGSIGLRQEQSELVAANAEGRIRSTQGILQRGGGGAQDFIAARMAVRIVYFLEAMEIENYQAERLAITARAIQFLFERFAEQAAIVQASKCIGNRVQL